MALNEEYEVNQKLVDLLTNTGKGGRSIVPVINSAFTNAPDPILVKLIIDLRALVPLLDEWRKDAVQSILTMDWSAKSDEVVKEHSQLLISIGAAHACHLDNVLRYFVKKFLPSSSIPPNESLEEYDAKNSESSSRAWNESHKCIALILDIIPTSKRRLVKILKDTYPFMKRHVVLLRDYARNLLTITSYAQYLRVDILGVIVEELVKLDTTCSQEALEALMNDSTASSSDGEVFQMETDENGSRKAYIKEILDMRTKLDVCMYDAFKYLSSIGIGEEEDKVSAFYTDLLSIFESSILPVYSSHHVQFLWFVLCGYDEQLWKHFLSWLWQRIQTPAVISSIRQNAASYLASILARAAYLDIEVVTTYVQTWISWIHSYINNQEGTGAKENASVHGTFYSLCQAVFYVIVFRVKEILDMRKGHDFLKSLNLDRIVTCRLNPLKYCAEKVVINFANVSRNYQFAFCYTILERNRRSAFFDQRRTGVAPHQLMECFFPFDPYLLPKSIEFVAPLYRNYEEGTIDEVQITAGGSMKNVDHDDVDDFLEAEMDDDRSEMICDYDTTARELMFSYSTSPGFKQG